MFAQSSLGNASAADLAPGFTPQSMRILLSGVVSIMLDLPT